MSTQYDLDDIDPEVLDAMQTILEKEETIRSAAETIRSEIGRLSGRTIPFDHNGYTQFGTVTAIRGHGTYYAFEVRNDKTGVVRRVRPYLVFDALRRLNQEA